MDGHNGAGTGTAEQRALRSRQLDLSLYRTDKISNNYLPVYDPILAPLVERDVKLLELGVFEAESLRLWRDYFPKGTIVGVDSRRISLTDSGTRIHIYQGEQQDRECLSRLARERAPEGFDIIIDDASHIGDLTRASFWHLFENHLKPGGLYVIEDWGTGYWGDWPDGRSHRPPGKFLLGAMRVLRRLRLSQGVYFHNHNWGMVGFIKELIDEQGAHDLTRASVDKKPKRWPKFKQVLVTPSIVFVTKAGSG